MPDRDRIHHPHIDEEDLVRYELTNPYFWWIR